MATDPAAERAGRLSVDGGREIAGRYQLRELIGRGGMGEVHAGWDRRLERPVAIKTLRADVAAQVSARRRFESEARSAARLVHPHVVAVYDSGEDHGIPFMVMELLPSRSLKDEIARGPMDVRSVQSLASQVLAALGAAHASGIVHRDIKPANILAAGEGQWKVGDFGIAKSVQLHGSDETATGMVLGTPAYLAPERLFGGEATPGGDLYSLGIILYEALASRRPFQAASPEGWATVISAHQIEPLLRVRRDIPPAMASAVERSIARDPATRFSSAGEMAEAMGVRRNGAPDGLGIGGAGVAGAAAAASSPTDPAGADGPVSWKEIAPASSAEATAVLAAGGPASTQVIPASSERAAPDAGGSSVGLSGGPVPSARSGRRRRDLAVLGAGAAVAGILGISIAGASSGGRSPATHVTTPGTVATTAPPTTPAPATTVPPPPPAHHPKGGDKGGGGGDG